MPCPRRPGVPGAPRTSVITLLAVSGLLAACDASGVSAPRTRGTQPDAVASAAAATPVFGSFALSPAAPVIAAGGSQQFTVAGTWSTGASTVPPVKYSATGGSITANGVYTASAVPGTYRVVATHARGTAADTSVVVVTQALASLRSLASARGLALGVAVDVGPFRTDALYRETLASQFNEAVPESGNSMKMGPILWTRGTHNFTDADAFVAWAQSSRMSVHGGVMVWHEDVPAWLANGTFTKREMLAVLKDYVTAVVGHYAGKVTGWDLVNEAVDWNGTLRRSLFLTRIGPEFIDSSFVWAHRADPAARLYLNDFDAEGLGVKSDSIFALVKRLRARGVPVTGVGLQAHYPTAAGTIPSVPSIRSNLARFANIGLDVRISEMDVGIANTAGRAAMLSQAATYRDMLDLCLTQPRCRGITTWGVSDRYSAIPKYRPGLGRGLPLDSNFHAKPAFDSLAARLRRK